MEKKKTNKKSSLENLLDEISPEQQARTDNRMMLAASIADAMEAKGWNNTQLMEALGKKNPSEITRWLSGTHNFTVDTLTDLGRVLDRNFFNLTTDKEYQIPPINISIITYSGSSEWAPAVVSEPDEVYNFNICNDEIG